MSQRQRQHNTRILSSIKRIFTRRNGRVYNASEETTQEPDDMLIEQSQRAASPEHNIVSPSDVMLFDESPRALSPRAVSAPAKINELSRQITAAPSQKIVRAPRRIQKNQTREIRNIGEEQKNRYFVGREYELYRRVYSNPITIGMLNHQLKPPFNPSVLNSSVIDLLKTELESLDYKRLNDLINSSESKNIRKQKGDVEVIDVRALLISKFLSKITIIDLKNHVIDEFTLEVLNSIDKSKVFFIIFYDIDFKKNDATSCSNFLEYLREYKNRDKVKSLIVGKINIYGEDFEKLVDIIGELESITFLFFLDFNIVNAMDIHPDEYICFDEIFMKSLIKLENLKMLIFSDNYIENRDFENIFVKQSRLLLYTYKEKDFIDFEPMSIPSIDDIIKLKEEGGITKYYTKKCEKKQKEGGSNNRMRLTLFTLHEDEVVSSERSFHFYTGNNIGDNRKMLINLDDMLIKRNYYGKIFGILQKCFDKDTKAIKKAMLKQQEEDMVEKTKKEKTAQIDYLASKAFTTRTHLDANKATQLAIVSNTANNNHLAISRAVRKSRAATRAFNNEQTKEKIANDAATTADAARKAVMEMKAVARSANASSSPQSSSSSLSKKIEALKQSPGSDSPKKGTSKGGKKPPKRK